MFNPVQAHQERFLKRNLERLVHYHWMVLAVLLLWNVTIIFCQEQQFPENDINVGRISYIHNSVLLKRGDAEEWYDAGVNAPIQTGDRIYTEDNGRTELQFDGNLYRLNYNTGFDLLDLSNTRSQFSLYTGTLTVYLRYNRPQPIEIDLPEASITLSKPGVYRMDAFESGGMKMVVWQGEAEVYNGTSIPVYTNQQIVVQGNNYDLTVADPPDQWDLWNRERNDRLVKADQCRKYIPENESMVGVEELDYYGQWHNVPEYGWAWTPTTVGRDWAPYREGRWVWRDPYGWTWVSTEHWGWAPYHYGRWIYVRHHWYWTPGRVRRYSPALVGFISYNDGEYIGWVPLAPQDEFVPWWHPGMHRRNTTIVYYHQSSRVSITFTTARGLASGEVHHRDIVARREVRLQESRPITVVPVVPTRRSLAPVRERAIPGNEKIKRSFDRSVVLRNKDIPVVRPFSEKLVEIKQRQGMPVSDLQRDTKGGQIFRDGSSFNKGSGTAGTTRDNRPPSLVKQPGLFNSIGNQSKNNKSPVNGGKKDFPGNLPKPAQGTPAPAEKPEQQKPMSTPLPWRQPSTQEPRQPSPTRPQPQESPHPQQTPIPSVKPERQKPMTPPPQWRQPATQEPRQPSPTRQQPQVFPPLQQGPASSAKPEQQKPMTPPPQGQSPSTQQHRESSPARQQQQVFPRPQHLQTPLGKSEHPKTAPPLLPKRTPGVSKPSEQKKEGAKPHQQPITPPEKKKAVPPPKEDQNISP